jgi:dynactin-2
MFEMMHRWDNVSLQLPTIVSRLQALKSLHEGAASFSQGVQLLESQQDEIKKLLKFNGELMNQVSL